MFRHFPVHMAYTKMATFVNLPSGAWRAVVRRKGRYISETFKLREDARRWATAQERTIDNGNAPKKTYVASKTSLAHLIDLHIDDLADAKKQIGRTKHEALLQHTTAPLAVARAVIVRINVLSDLTVELRPEHLRKPKTLIPASSTRWSRPTPKDR